MAENKYHRPIITREWTRVREFPEWEISPDGLIRHIINKLLKSTYEDPRGYLCVQFRKEGRRYTRTVLSLQKKAWPSQYVVKKP